MKTSSFSGSIAAGSTNRHPSSEKSRRVLSIGSEMNLAKSDRFPQDPKDQEGAELLLSIATIVSKEIASSDKEIFDDENGDDLVGSGTSFVQPSILSDKAFTSSRPSYSISSLIENEHLGQQRIRTVSIDNEYGYLQRSSTFGQSRSMKTKQIDSSAVVTPRSSRLRTIQKSNLKFSTNRGKKEQTKFPKITTQQINNHNLPDTVSQHKLKALERCATKGKSITVINRKKFSWKNYPELEAFLVANREEYLRHSALNYTLQQKKYNNRLTERLLDLASEYFYVFNDDEFGFVTVRDRIRCFYKSYVQSSKKRGIVLGYAARKAGILTPADLQKYARKEGTIVTPHEL